MCSLLQIKSQVKKTVLYCTSHLWKINWILFEIIFTICICRESDKSPRALYRKEKTNTRVGMIIKYILKRLYTTHIFFIIKSVLMFFTNTFVSCMLYEINRLGFQFSHVASLFFVVLATLCQSFLSHLAFIGNFVNVEYI